MLQINYWEIFKETLRVFWQIIWQLWYIWVLVLFIAVIKLFFDKVFNHLKSKKKK
jgi:hypothetical protein